MTLRDHLLGPENEGLVNQLEALGIKDVEALAQKAINDRKFIDGSIRVPKEGASQADFDKAYRALGKPESAAGYGIEDSKLSEFAYANSLTKTQAEALKPFFAQQDAATPEPVAEPEPTPEPESPLSNLPEDTLSKLGEMFGGLSPEQIAEKLLTKENSLQTADAIVEGGTITNESNIEKAKAVQSKLKEIMTRPANDRLSASRNRNEALKAERLRQELSGLGYSSIFHSDFDTV